MIPPSIHIMHLLTKIMSSHAYASTRLEEWAYLTTEDHHDKDFGTKFYAVERRTKELFGFSLKSYAGQKYDQRDFAKGKENARK